MSTITADPDYRLLQGQTWQDYQQALAERDRSGRRYRITYDRGVLEIMPVSPPHARWQMQIAMLLSAYAAEKGIPFDVLGPFTCQREELERGIEPDTCFYVEHEAQVRGRDIDLDTDPLPDLAIEVEVSRPTTVRRIGIYAAFGVPEVWRDDGTTLSVLLLNPDGTYAPATASRAFPSLPLDEVIRRLAAAATTDRATWLRDWQAWVRANAAG
ncbi:MAG TPA: Uma2 family endonuclease [Gemmataceae bacterium]|nr:Uma2 family endonuclease [Gemmataceae bacterium]